MYAFDGDQLDRKTWLFAINGRRRVNIIGSYT
jgi:hypothetical protein